MIGRRQLAYCYEQNRGKWWFRQYAKAILNDDEFTKLFCRIHRCTSCPGKPLDNECRKRVLEWLKQEVEND